MPTRRRSSTVIQKESIEQANLALQQLPEKPKDNWSLREAIETLKDTILTALERGYTYEEVADFLSEQGVKISPSSLKSYLTAARKDPTEKRTRGRRRRSEAVLSEQPEGDSALDAALKPRRGRKPKALIEAEAAIATETEAEDSEEDPAPRKRGPRSTTVRRTTKSATRADSDEGEGEAKPRRGRRKSTAS